MLSEYILFFILTSIFVFFIFAVFYYNEQKKSLAVFYVIATIIFYTPSVYYTIFNGNAYRVFSSNSYLQYVIYCIIFFLILLGMVIIKNKLPVKNNFKFEKEPNNLVHLYIIYMLVAVLGYIAIYFDRFPLVSLLLNGARIERPDMSGSIPLYFTFSTFIFFVLPAYFLYYYERLKSNKLKFLAFLAISFLLLIGGNKGVLVYFYIFVWIFIFRTRINFKLLLMVVTAFSAYLFITGSAVTSGIRRFFATQGAALIVRFDMLNIGYDFDFDNINIQVFEYMYGYSGGSGPSFFVGDFMIMHGYFVGTLIMIFILGILFLISRIVDKYFDNRLFVLWSFTAVVYILGMGSFDFPAFCRIVAVILNVIIMLSLENVKQLYSLYEKVIDGYANKVGFINKLKNKS